MFAKIGSLITAVSVLTATQAICEEEVLLTIYKDRGASPSAPPLLALGLSDLQALPETTFETTTIWTDGSSAFTGVSLADLLDHVQVEADVILATALNEYQVTLPGSDAVDDGPIVAYLRDGAPMSVRDKGPLWIIYPFDDNPEYQSEDYFSRSIWQLSQLEVIAAN
ncbi:MAG: molybdopterin-dependent oxidoreductase [Pelagimonas sp.]|jgi:hypothetical protein|nr:molybdopterin-dependent oxidoreductase [Pelagimonas sp.]